MSGIKALRKLQMGAHTSSDSGDAIPATSIWRGMGTLEDARNFYFVAEDVGIMTGTDRSNISQLGSKLSLDATEATYEQLPYLCEMAIQTATPTADSDAGSGYAYQYTFPTTAANTIKPYCWEGGDNQQAEVANYMHCADFSLAGDEGKAWMMSANLFGRDVNNDTFTAGLTLPAVNHANFGQSYFYIDNDSDDFGDTVVSQTLLASTFKYATNFVAKHPANGRLDFSFVQPTMPEISLAVTFEHDGTAVTEKGYWRTQTPRLIRIKNEGVALTTAGAYTYRTIQLDIAGKFTKFNKLGERNGNDVLEATFIGRYNAAQATAGNILIVNELSALP
jgi:hypothetical protein